MRASAVSSPRPASTFARLLATAFVSSLCAACANTASAPSVPALDKTHGTMVDTINGMAGWVDGFFEDPNYQVEEADSRLVLGQSVVLSDRESARFRTRALAKLSLPNVSRHLRLTFEGNDDVPFADEGEDDLRASFDEAVDNPAFGIQYARVSPGGELYYGLSTGVRLGNPSVYLGPRVRFRQPIGDRSRLRYSAQLRWYTQDGWDSRARVDVDRLISRRGFIRQTLDAHWREEDERSQGFLFTADTSYTRQTSPNAALRFRWRTRYRTQPDRDWESTELAVRLRRRIYRNWMYVDIEPFVSFEDRFDWKANVGVTLSLDVIFERDEVSSSAHLIR